MKAYGSLAYKRQSDKDHETDPSSSRVIHELESEQAALLTTADSSSSHDQSTQSGMARTGRTSSGFAALALCVVLATLGYSSKSTAGSNMLRPFLNTNEMVESAPNAFTLASSEFKLLSFGASGSCPEYDGGTSVSKEQCYDAAKAVGDEAGFTIANDALNVGTWSFLPCGCFLYDAGAEKWIDYKDPSLGNCGPARKSALVCEAPPIELYDPGEGNGRCPGNQAISKAQCLEAATKVGKEAGMTALKDFLNVGTWPFTPCGCFIYDASWIDYKDPGVGNCNPDTRAQLVCLEEDPMTVSPGDSKYEILEAGEGGGVCPHVLAVSEEECLEAAQEVGGAAGLTRLHDFLNVGSWPFTPCGCFIYIDRWIDYKDPALGNCKPDSDSKLICKKPSKCDPPDDHPCATDSCKHTCVIKPGK